MELNVCFMIAQGTEVTEFLATKDVLERAGIRPVEFGNGFRYQTNINQSYRKFESDRFSAIIFPGGGLGTQNVKNEAVQEPFKSEILKMAKDGKLVAAICAAPSILGELGLLKGKRYTCYPGFSSDSFEGEYTAGTVEVDGNIITGRSMYYSVDFGLAIVEYLLGKEKRDEIERQVKGLT